MDSEVTGAGADNRHGAGTPLMGGADLLAEGLSFHVKGREVTHRQVHECWPFVRNIKDKKCKHVHRVPALVNAILLNIYQMPSPWRGTEASHGEFSNLKALILSLLFTRPVLGENREAIKAYSQHCAEQRHSALLKDAPDLDNVKA